ncbi:PIN domain-containing protein [Nonomuraea cavernae]|uniref:PIN domain-containing protein n=1 Tax=Nonomuraea cavernae TaxID=2045107 RepID=UPI001CD95195|nr:PIN domain-containing protein [Nonomuraea cavernae]MCA2188708.1 PIN domain-containing protein [Nonomuraea cavernae]
MTAGVVYLIDRSALARMPNPVVGWVLEPLLLDRMLAVCTVTQLEVLVSARDLAGYERDAWHLREDFRRLAIDADVQARALDVQALLVRTSRHGCVGPRDLLIAACAEVHGATLLHYDRDFDLISKVTGQASLWVVPPGSVP